MNEHRMQHASGPTWCRDCGRFNFACEGIPCPSPGSGRFDTSTLEGCKQVAGCLLEKDAAEAGRLVEAGA